MENTLVWNFCCVIIFSWQITVNLIYFTCSDCPLPSPLPFSFPPNPLPPFDAYHAAGTIYFPLSVKAYRKVKHVGLDFKGNEKKKQHFGTWVKVFVIKGTCKAVLLMTRQNGKQKIKNKRKKFKKRENKGWPRTWPRFTEKCIVWACFALLEPSINTHVLS